MLAGPWWVNLLIVVPFLAYYLFRKGVRSSRETLIIAGAFGIAFGFVEAAVVIYLRAAVGLLSPAIPTAAAVASFPPLLFSVEFAREAATMIMLAAFAFLIAKAARERWAMFLWTFAFWDLFYYVFLRLVIGWPISWRTIDVLFLIPAPWYAPVWFPIATDILMIAAILARI